MNKYKFKDICDVINGRAYKQHELLDGGKYKILRVGNFFSSDKWYYSNLELEENKYCDNNDLLFAWSASFGPKLWNGGKVIYHYHIWKLLPKENTDKHYLYYWLLNSTKKILAGTHGSVMAHITKADMENQDIILPSFNVQKKIAAILSILDKKIAINDSINNNLEQQALAIYKQQIVENCNYNKNGFIKDYCDVKSGFAFKGTWWQNEGVKVIKIKTIDNDSINFKDCSFVTEDKIESAKDFVVTGGDIVIAMTGATIGKFAIIPKVTETLLVNQRVGKFFLGDAPLERTPFLYCLLKQADVITEIINRGQGSAQPNISSSDIMSTPCYMPSKDIIGNFNSICKPIFENIITNKYENEQLTQLRDTLLPKLMSGEIDVENVDISTDKLLFSEK